MNPIRIGLVMAFVTILGIGGFGVRKGAASGALDALPMTVEPEKCLYFCKTCPTRPENHDIVTATTNNAKSSHLESCEIGSCTSHACGSALAAAEIRRAWNDIIEAPTEHLEKLLAKYDHVVSYNEERNAIQFTCEKGKLIANLPATPEQVPILLAHNRTGASAAPITTAE